MCMCAQSYDGKEKNRNMLTAVEETSRQLQGGGQRAGVKMLRKTETRGQEAIIRKTWNSGRKMWWRVHTKLCGWMKDKANADTQRTEAVNCMAEITGGERGERRGEERRRWRQTGTERGEKMFGQIRRKKGNERSGENGRLLSPCPTRIKMCMRKCSHKTGNYAPTFIFIDCVFICSSRRL